MKRSSDWWCSPRRMKIYPNAYYNYLKRRKAEYCKKKEEVCRGDQENLSWVWGIYNAVYEFFCPEKGSNWATLPFISIWIVSCSCTVFAAEESQNTEEDKSIKYFQIAWIRSFTHRKPIRSGAPIFTYLFLSNGAVRFNCSIIDLYDRSEYSENGKWITSELAIQTVKESNFLPRGTLCGWSYIRIRAASIHRQNLWHSVRNTVLFKEDKGRSFFMTMRMERYYNTLKSELINQYQFKLILSLIMLFRSLHTTGITRSVPNLYNNYLTPFQKRFALR